MSNGYTRIIGEGATFKEFATRCARAMIPCIKQRDEGLDSPPRPQIPNTEHDDKMIKSSQDRLAALEKMSQGEREAAALAEFSEALSLWQKRIENTAALRQKYEAMLADVKAWKAPTPEHETLRSFMIREIDDAIRFDCITWEAPRPTTGDEWFSARIESAARTLASAIESKREEIAVTARRNAWIVALLESL